MQTYYLITLPYLAYNDIYFLKLCFMLSLSRTCILVKYPYAYFFQVSNFWHSPSAIVSESCLDLDLQKSFFLDQVKLDAKDSEIRYILKSNIFFNYYSTIQILFITI